MMVDQSAPTKNFTSLNITELEDLYCHYKKNNWPAEAITDRMLILTGKTDDSQKDVDCAEPPLLPFSISSSAVLRGAVVFAILAAVGICSLLILIGITKFRDELARKRALRRTLDSNGYFAATSYSRWQQDRVGLARKADRQRSRLVATSFDSAEVCAICLETIYPVQTVRALRCMHVYHVTCIDNWLRGNHSCPVCRYEPRRAQRQHRIHQALSNIRAAPSDVGLLDERLVNTTRPFIPAHGV